MPEPSPATDTTAIAGALAAALRVLLSDAELRDRMGACKRERAFERFSVEAMSPSYEALYDRLVAPDAP